MEQPPGGVSGHAEGAGVGSGEGGGVAWLPPVGTPLKKEKEELSAKMHLI